MSLLTEIQEAIQELKSLEIRLKRYEAFQSELMAHLDGIGLTAEQKARLAWMLIGK